jgi:hypothetical protein
MDVSDAMSKQKIVFSELFGNPTTSLIQTHPTNNDVFAVTGDDQLKLCRFDWEKSGKRVLFRFIISDLF